MFNKCNRHWQKNGMNPSHLKDLCKIAVINSIAKWWRVPSRQMSLMIRANSEWKDNILFAEKMAASSSSTTKTFFNLSPSLWDLLWQVQVVVVNQEAASLKVCAVIRVKVEIVKHLRALLTQATQAIVLKMKAIREVINLFKKTRIKMMMKKMISDYLVSMQWVNKAFNLKMALNNRFRREVPSQQFEQIYPFKSAVLIKHLNCLSIT